MASCPSCESAVDREDNYCRSCGAELPTPDEISSYPPEASPMFGGEKWSQSANSQFGESGAGTQSANSSSEKQSKKPLTYPPESSPMFGGETWTMPTTDDAQDDDTQEPAADTQSSPSVEEQNKNAIRNMVIYAAVTVGAFGAWYLFF